MPYLDKNDLLSQTRRHSDEILVPEQPHPNTRYNRVSLAWEPDVERVKTELRAKREPLLTEADHKIRSHEDLGSANATIGEWRSYRKALRDVTTQTDYLNPVWPTKPTA